MNYFRIDSLRVDHVAAAFTVPNLGHAYRVESCRRTKALSPTGSEVSRFDYSGETAALNS
jgi:hypothetical protein